MNNNPEWLGSIKQKALENNRTLRDQQIEDGLYLYMEYRARVDSQISLIRGNPEWYTKIVEKAQETGISVERQLKIEAVSIVEGGVSELYNKSDGENKNLQYYINIIKNDAEWMKGIIEKAKQNNISAEEQLKLDAIWTMENE